jgi:dipeptidase E
MRLYLSSFRIGNKPEELLRLLGDGRRTALMMNALDFLDPSTRAALTHQEMERLHSIGLDSTEIDLRHYFGRTAELREALGQFDLVWVHGGNCFVLRRAFRHSGMDKVANELLASDALVYGGYSAGIDMLTPSLHGAELVDDPTIVPAGYDSPIIWECLGLVPYAIAPHYKSDHPESAAVDKSVEFFIDNHIPFIALRDGEAIVVDGASQQVVG